MDALRLLEPHDLAFRHARTALAVSVLGVLVLLGVASYEVPLLQTGSATLVPPSSPGGDRVLLVDGGHLRAGGVLLMRPASASPGAPWERWAVMTTVSAGEPGPCPSIWSGEAYPVQLIGSELYRDDPERVYQIPSGGRRVGELLFGTGGPPAHPGRLDPDGRSAPPLLE